MQIKIRCGMRNAPLLRIAAIRPRTGDADGARGAGSTELVVAAPRRRTRTISLADEQFFWDSQRVSRRTEGVGFEWTSTDWR